MAWIVIWITLESLRVINPYYIFSFIIELSGDDYIARNGRDGTISDQAYTLSRLRKEERLLQAGYPLIDKLEGLNLGSGNFGQESPDSFENHEGHLEQIDEMYDNMNQFDYKLKTLK